MKRWSGINHRETVRHYLDVEIGRCFITALLGEPIRSLREISREVGKSKSWWFFQERQALRKIGVAVRHLAEADIA